LNEGKEGSTRGREKAGREGGREEGSGGIRETIVIGGL
jgi:hypothetical protein